MLKNAYAAALAAFGVDNRHLARCRFQRHLAELARLLEDARALTSAAELHEAFARSHSELQSLLRGLQDPSSARRAYPEVEVAPLGEPAAADSHWPYLAF